MNQENNNFNGMPTGPAFDPMTGQPIQPQQPVQPQGFDPMTGQPIQQPVQQPMQQPVQNPAFAQAPQQPVQPQVGQPQKKSNNKLFIIGGICLAIVAVIVVIIALTGGAGGKSAGAVPCSYGAGSGYGRPRKALFRYDTGTRVCYGRALPKRKYSAS